MKRKLFMVVGAGTVLAASGISGAKQTPPASKPVLSGARYKNTKLLKALPADRLIPTMREYGRSLNVKCDFCHQLTTNTSGTVSGYELDGNPMKRKARDMIRMMDSLNKNSKTIDGQATCFMCHHGHPEPVTQAPEAE